MLFAELHTTGGDTLPLLSGVLTSANTGDPRFSRTLCFSWRRILISLMAVTGKPLPSPSSCLMHLRATSLRSFVRVALKT